jgi:phospho-N-acetylmuramoyl-pentapeptide-transferase
MLYNILYPLAEQFSALNVFRYLTFRTGGAIITALVISFLFGPVVINMLRDRQKGGQPIRENGPTSHLLTKKGTPTMGGFLILLALTIATLLWADLYNGYIWAALGVTLAFGVIGFLDDYMKVTQRNTKGLPGKLKFLMQVAISSVAALYIMSQMP